MYPCATMATGSNAACDVAFPPPETHGLRGSAEDGVGETLDCRDGPRGNAPGRPDQLCGGACRAGVWGPATGGGHPALPSSSALSLSSVSLLSAVPALL